MQKENLDFLPKVNLLAYIGSDTELTPVASAEYAGACPMCGGADRLHVTATRWFCRQCTPRWDNVIGYVQKHEGVGFRQACRLLRQWLAAHPVSEADDAARAATFLFDFSARRGERSETTQALPPSTAWQDHMRVITDDAAFNLYSNDLLGTHAQARQYLSARGLSAETISAAGLGYLQSGLVGISIPLTMAGQLWGIKVRLLDNPTHKYQLIKGSKQGALYGADEVRGLETLVICEGEFDALLLRQICPFCDVVTPGSAANPIHEAWLPYSAQAQRIIICMDNDDAGREAARRWSQWVDWRLATEPRIIFPQAKDITEDYQAGVDLSAWLFSAL